MAIETTQYVKKRQMEEASKKYKKEIKKNENVLGRTKEERKAASDYYRRANEYYEGKRKQRAMKEVEKIKEKSKNK